MPIRLVVFAATCLTLTLAILFEAWELLAMVFLACVSILSLVLGTGNWGSLWGPVDNLSESGDTGGSGDTGHTDDACGDLSDGGGGGDGD